MEEPVDTTKLTFIWGSKRVRLFRRDMQMASDSLAYNDIDSLVRVYQDPVFFNEGNKQYASDSIMLVVKNKTVQKAHLLSNAFITMQQDSKSYNQIKGAEMVAYFDSTSALTRFDALGGAASIFFLAEQNALATVNKVESKMIYATFKDGDIERMYYYDNPKNDGYPTVQLPQDERQLKGFRWEPEKRPKSPLDVTTLVPRQSQRTSYLARPHTKFTQTDIYFPGHIKKVYRDIALRDSLKVERSREESRRKAAQAAAEADSLARIQADSTIVEAADTLASTPPPADSLATVSPADTSAISTPAPADTLQTQPVVPDKKALREAEKKRKAEERARKKAEKQKALEAKWAEQDKAYEERQAAKNARKLEKERARKLKALRKLEKKSQKERELLDKYILKEQLKLKNKK